MNGQKIVNINALTYYNKKILECINDSIITPIYSNPGLDFESTDNNANCYGYVGTLKNINVKGDLILVDSISVYVRENGDSPNLDTPVWCRLLRFNNESWEVVYQSTEAKSIKGILPETLFTFKMRAMMSNKLIKSTDRISIVYVSDENADVLSGVQLGFKAIVGTGGGLANVLVNNSPGVPNWCPAFVIGYLSMADTPVNAVTIENEQTIAGKKQFNDGISISGKSFITSAIDPGELKLLHNDSSKGFIIRTVNGDYDLLPLEILSTNGWDSYKYSFPQKSGIVLLDSNLGEGLSVTDGVVNCNSTTVKMSDGVSIEDTINFLLDRIKTLEETIEQLTQKTQAIVENNTLKFLKGATVENNTLKLISGDINNNKLIL